MPPFLDDGLSHEFESDKDALFPGDERSPFKENKGHRRVLAILHETYPQWVLGNAIAPATGYPSDTRRGRELAHAGRIERGRIGSQVAWRWLPPGQGSFFPNESE